MCTSSPQFSTTTWLSLGSGIFLRSRSCGYWITSSTTFRYSWFCSPTWGTCRAFSRSWSLGCRTRCIQWPSRRRAQRLKPKVKSRFICPLTQMSRWIKMRRLDSETDSVCRKSLLLTNLLGPRPQTRMFPLFTTLSLISIQRGVKAWLKILGSGLHPRK